MPKKVVPSRGRPSGPGESSRQAEARGRRSSRQSQQGSQSQPSGRSRQQPPAPQRAVRKILKPRLIDFESMDSMFPELSALFYAQGWESFVCSHTKYYPALVEEFYGNFHEKEVGVWYTTVSGKYFQVSLDMLHRALGIPTEGAMLRVHPISLELAHFLMTGQEPEGLNVDFILYNANDFPPLQRMIHHIITTIIYPKAGSRELVNNVHKFLFHFMMQGAKVNLCDLMMELMIEVVMNKRRSLPYASALTEVFKHQNVNLENEQVIEIPKVDIYTAYKVQIFMGYRMVDGVVRRAGDHISENEEEEEEQGEEENRNAGHGEGQENAPEAQAEEHAAEQAPVDRGFGGDWAAAQQRHTQRLDTIDGRLMGVEQTLGHYRSTLDNVTSDIAEIRITQRNMFEAQTNMFHSLQSLTSFMENQSKFFDDMRRYFPGAPPDDPNM